MRASESESSARRARRLAAERAAEATREVVEGRAVIDWSHGGVVVDGQGVVVGHVDDLPDEVLAAMVNL